MEEILKEVVGGEDKIGEDQVTRWLA